MFNQVCMFIIFWKFPFLYAYSGQTSIRDPRVRYITHHNSLDSSNSNLVFLISALLTLLVTVAWKEIRIISCLKNLKYKVSDKVVPRSYSTTSFDIFPAMLFWIESKKKRVKLSSSFFPQLHYFLSPQLRHLLCFKGKNSVTERKKY